MSKSNVIILHRSNDQNNTNGEFHVIRDGIAIIQGIFNTAFLDKHAADLEEVTNDLFNDLPADVQSQLVNGSTYVLNIAKESQEAVQAVMAAAKNPNIVTGIKAAKETIEAGIAIGKGVAAIKKAKQAAGKKK
jgi:hypothetical protein